MVDDSLSLDLSVDGLMVLDSWSVVDSDVVSSDDMSLDSWSVLDSNVMSSDGGLGGWLVVDSSGLSVMNSVMMSVDNHNWLSSMDDTFREGSSGMDRDGWLSDSGGDGMASSTASADNKAALAS